MGRIIRRIHLMIKLLLRSMLAPAADPREVFATAHQRHIEYLARVRSARENLSQSRAQLVVKASEARAKLPELDTQAREALMNGREDLARLALQLRAVASSEAESADSQAQNLEQEEHALTLVEHRLANEIESVATRQRVLEARYSSAEAQVQVHEALGGVSTELANLGSALEETEQRKAYIQARAEAIDRLVKHDALSLTVPGANDDSTGDSSEKDIDDRLEKLRRELALD